MIDYNDIRVGDFFTEVGAYQVIETKPESIKVLDLRNGAQVTLSRAYVEASLTSAEQYQQEVFVGKEDTFWTAKKIEAAVASGKIAAGSVKIGDLETTGIRSIFMSIPTGVAITCCFRKKDTLLSEKAYQNKLSSLVETVKSEVMSGTLTLPQALTNCLENPVSRVIPGEMRVMCGYKKEMTSPTSDYTFCDVRIVDASSPTGFKSENRTVDLSTMQWIIFNGTKYTVK